MNCQFKSSTEAQGKEKEKEKEKHLLYFCRGNQATSNSLTYLLHLTLSYFKVRELLEHIQTLKYAEAKYLGCISVRVHLIL